MVAKLSYYGFVELFKFLNYDIKISKYGVLCVSTVKLLSQTCLLNRSHWSILFFHFLWEQIYLCNELYERKLICQITAHKFSDCEVYLSVLVFVTE
jgi:hypothetical protein